MGGDVIAVVVAVVVVADGVDEPRELFLNKKTFGFSKNSENFSSGMLSFMQSLGFPYLIGRAQYDLGGHSHEVKIHFIMVGTFGLIVPLLLIFAMI